MAPKRKAARVAPQPRGFKFSLASHLFGFPAADGCADSESEPPGPWLETFVAHHADAAILLGLFCSCKAGRDWVVTSAKDLRISLVASAERPVHAVKQQLSAVQQALTLRGDRQCGLLVGCGPQWQTSSTRMLQLLPRYLRGAGTGFTQLILVSPIGSDNQQAMEALTDFLRASAPALSHLTKLCLFCCPIILPQPKKLPALRELVMEIASVTDNAQETLFSSVAPYLPQLTHFSCDIRAPVMYGLMGYMQPLTAPWGLMMLPSSKSETLTLFRVTATLDETLLGLLLDHCPALKELKVADMDLESDEYTHRQWGVEKFTVRNFGPNADMLALLPKSSVEGGRVKVFCDRPEMLLVADLLEPFVARLSEWEFQIDMVTLACGSDTPREALETLLTQLSDMCVPQGVVMLVDWQWTHEMAQMVASALPGLSHLKVGVLAERMTDDVLGMVMAMGPHLRDFGVNSMDLQTDTHKNARWPWVKLAIIRLPDATQLLRLPHPSTFEGNTPTEKPTLSTNLVLRSSLSQADADSLKAWLTPLHSQGLLYSVHHTPRSPANTLTRQLSVLHSVTFTDPAKESRAVLVLNTLSLNKPTLDILRENLPHWSGILGLSSCTWPLKASEYKRLADVIPMSYKAWLLNEKKPTARLDAICDGVNARRKGLGLQPLQLEVPACPGTAHVGEHVIVTDSLMSEGKEMLLGVREGLELLMNEEGSEDDFVTEGESE